MPPPPPDDACTLLLLPPGGKMSFTDFIDTWILRKKGDSGSEASSVDGSNKPLGRSSRSSNPASSMQPANKESSGRVMATLGRYIYP